ncbi:hypothetical protein, partial [Algoriphagus sp.]|uniref:hypothetical protein n=1 Tax=Algoriphagus sp. TaxID=1872435 RepID=UPI0026144018
IKKPTAMLAFGVLNPKTKVSPNGGPVPMVVFFSQQKALGVKENLICEFVLDDTELKTSKG